MMIAARTRISHSRSRAFIAPLTAFSSLLVVLLGGCQTDDGPNAEHGLNQLATALAVPPAKFADGVVASGLSTPMAMEFAPDGRLFVVEKSGAVKVVGAGGATTTYLTLSVDQNTERGLLGITFDPEWSTQKYVYIHYSVPGGGGGVGANRVSRFTQNASNPNIADLGSEVVLFDLDPLATTAYHNGGALHFVNDSILCVTTGDNRNPTSAQDRTKLLGKILRFNKRPSGTAGMPNIPSDNPFCTTQGVKTCAVWGLGLRNPFTFAVHPVNHRIFINDVGDAGYEEINEATQSGLNFGWPNSEGPTSLGGINGPLGGYVNGFAANGGQYNVGDCAVVGAAFYYPPAGKQQFPSNYLGKYFYGDHCSSYIKTMDPDAAAPVPGIPFATAINGHIMDLDVGPDGALYYLTLEGGIGKVTYTGSDAPSIASQPASQTVSVNQSVTFSVQANGGNLSYQWQRGGVNIAGATGTSYVIASAQLSDNSNNQFRVIVSNGIGVPATSNTATLTVISNQPPVPVITTPAATLTWNAGQTITYSGSATDPEDGTLGAAAFTWKVDLAHDAHTHPAVNPVSGSTGGTFTIPAINETSPNISYRIYLTVTDSKGLSATVTRDIQPNKVSVTITTVPSGLTINVDGQPKPTPYLFNGVVGVLRTLTSVSPQTLNGNNYTFASWSDAGASQHDIATPGTNTTYTATFTTVGGRIPLPGRIEAENFRTGGEGTGYHDNEAANLGPNVYRTTEGVDIEASTDVGGGFNVGWTNAGEWLAHDVSVPAAGSYKLTARMASATVGTKTMAVKLDNVNNAAIATFNFTDASGWQSWKDVVLTGINLPAGNHTLFFTMTTGNFNLNYIDVASTGNLAPTANAGLDKSGTVNTAVAFSGTGSDPDNGPQALSYAWSWVSGPVNVTPAPANSQQPSFTPTVAGTYVFRLTVSDGAATAMDDIQVTVTSGATGIALPGRIEAEAFKTGGEGVGYHDNEPANLGPNVYRTSEGVDIEVANDVGNGYNVGWTNANEWLAFDVNVTNPGNYNLTARLASQVAGTKTVLWSVDGGPTSTFTFTDASGWQSWKNVVLTGVNLPSSGNHVVRLTFPNGGLNINYVDVSP